MKFCLILSLVCFFCFTFDISATDDICSTEIQCEEGCEEGGYLPKWINFRWHGSQSFITVVDGIGCDIQATEKDAYDKIEQSAVDRNGKECLFSEGKLNCNETVNRKLAKKPYLRKAIIKREINIQHEGCQPEYKVYLLVHISSKPSIVPVDSSKQAYDNVEISNDYPFSGRVFVPGMAQIYKGQNLKGALFIAGEALFIGGLAASFGVSSHYKDRHNNETNTERRNKYGDWANAAYYTGWTFVGLAAVLYIANIIDGVVSPGEEALFKIETDEKGKETSREKIKFVYAPTATPYSFGLAMNLNF